MILWTRCSPRLDDVHSNSSTSGLVPLYNPVPIVSPDEHEREHVVSNAPVCLDYKVAEDESFGNVASQGTVHTSSDVDYTVKVSRLFENAVEEWLIRGPGRSSQVGAIHHLLLSVPGL